MPASQSRTPCRAGERGRSELAQCVAEVGLHRAVRSQVQGRRNRGRCRRRARRTQPEPGRARRLAGAGRGDHPAAIGLLAVPGVDQQGPNPGIELADQAGGLFGNEPTGWSAADIELWVAA